MTQQYIRAISLVVGTTGGAGLDLSALRVTFSVQNATAQTPKSLIARIYNLSKETAATVQREFTRVILSAGYQDAPGVLFNGQIRQTKLGRESATDTFLEITAADGDEVYSTGIISQTLAAGATSVDVFREIVSAGGPLGLTAGTPPPATIKSIRPIVLHGAIRDLCRTLAASTGTSWSITDGALNFTPLRPVSTAPQQAVVLSPSTGLIGIPNQTIDGIEGTCLLNAQIKIDGYVKLDGSLINAGSVDRNVMGTSGGNLVGTGSNQSVAGLSPSGTYRVVFVEHEGDTRVDAWYTTFIGFADDGNAKAGNAALTAVP